MRKNCWSLSGLGSGFPGKKCPWKICSLSERLLFLPASYGRVLWSVHAPPEQFSPARGTTWVLGLGLSPCGSAEGAITAPICGWPLCDTANGKLASPQGFITSDVPYTTRWLTTAKLLRQLSTTSKDNLCLSSIHRTVKDELHVACPSSPLVSWVRKLFKEGILVLDVICRTG